MRHRRWHWSRVQAVRPQPRPMHERTDNRPHIEDSIMTKLQLATLALAIVFIAAAPAFASPTDWLIALSLTLAIGILGVFALRGGRLARRRWAGT
jgi:peptidoglycan/LPS O-acetylase OafA/YrhL